MKKIISILLLSLTVAVTVNAQEFLNNLRDKQAGKGKVTVSQSKEIDELLKSPAKQQTTQSQQTQAQQKTTTAQPQQKTASTQSQQKVATAQPQQKAVSTQYQQKTSAPATPGRVQASAKQQKSEAQHATTPTKKTTHVTQQSDLDNDEYNVSTVDTRKKVMRKSYRMPGYRIQVFSGGNSRQDKQKAFNAGAVIKRNFPDQPVYAHFKSPSWKCRMGNFKSQYEAEKLLHQVKKLGFPQATIVKDNIQVQY